MRNLIRSFKIKQKLKQFEIHVKITKDVRFRCVPDVFRKVKFSLKV